MRTKLSCECARERNESRYEQYISTPLTQGAATNNPCTHLALLSSVSSELEAATAAAATVVVP